MGNRTATPTGQDPTLDARQIDSEDSCAIFQDSTGEEYEKYQVLSDGSTNFQNAYAFRVANRHLELVDVLYAGPQKNQFGCTERTRYEVVTERIPYRLSHIPTLQPHNALLVLRSCLNGFKDVFSFHGLVSVKDSMIGITRTNRVKVWLNSNFALNTLEPRPLSLQRLDPKSHEREMVNNIFDLISSKTQQDPLWTDLMQQRQAINPNTFESALHLLETFISSKGIRLAQELRNPFNKLLHHVRHEKSFTFNEVQSPTLQNYQNGERRDYRIQAGLQEEREMQSQSQTAGLGTVQFVPIFPLQHREANMNESHYHRQDVKMPFQELEKKLQPCISSQILIPVGQTIPFAEQTHIYRPPSHQPLPIYPPNITEQRIFRRPIENSSSKIRITFNNSQPVATVSQSSSVLNSIQNGEAESLPKQINHQQTFNFSSQLQEVPTFSLLPQPDNPPPAHPVPPSQPPFQPIPKQPSISIDTPAPRPQLLQQPHYQIQVHQVTSEQSLHEQLTNLIKQQHSQIQQPQDIMNDFKAQEAILNALEENTPPAYRFTVSIEESRPSQDNLQNIEELKTVVNASLVDTKQIKRSNAQDLSTLPLISKRSLSRPLQKNSLSYRQMRRLLLSATDQNL